MAFYPAKPANDIIVGAAAGDICGKLPCGEVSTWQRNAIAYEKFKNGMECHFVPRSPALEGWHGAGAQ